MTKKTDQNLAHALLSLYVNKFKTKYGKAPQINRYRDSWGFKDMMEDLSYDRAKEVIEYYFETNRPGHPLRALFNNYDRLDTIMRDKAKDEEERIKLREQTMKRVEAWQQRKQK